MPTATEVSERLARLATWKPGSGGRTVAPEDRLPIFLLVAGAVCMPLGFIVVLLGWWGAAHTPFGFEQTPYLISGGILGMALVFAGGFLFFGSWVARVALNSQRTADAIGALSAKLEGMGEGAGSDNGTTAPRMPQGRLVATSTGTMLHRPDCPIVASRDNIREVPPDKQGSLKPCQICTPLAAG